MYIKQFKYNSDNLSYLIHGTSDAIVIDGGAVNDILSYLDKNQLSLKYVLNTHSHGDHTSGNNRLLQSSEATFISVSTLIAEKTVPLENMNIKIYDTPGHTRDSICFHANDWLITGDTLFNGTVGNCFTNEDETFVNSLKKILTLPDHTIIYAGHDYVIPSMRFAKKNELNVRAVDAFLATYHPKHVCSSLSQEKAHNLFLRLNSPEIINLLQAKGFPHNNAIQQFHSLKEIEIWD
jgi:hydroxyacylglutathione hydrolase